MWFRHLEYSADQPVATLGPAAIDALLDRGDLEDWLPLLRAVARDPMGPLADTVLRLCDAHPMYGTSELWPTWIRRQRRRYQERAVTLAEARRRAGLTQAQMAERMGISQSDVSKLERRGDVHLSTLRAYADALGVGLRVSLAVADDEEPRPLAHPALKRSG